MRGFRVFVGCIPGNTVASELLELFNQYARVASINLALDTNSANEQFCLGYGFALCHTREDMLKLLECSNMIWYSGRLITLREYKVGSKLKDDKKLFNQRRLFIGNIPNSVSLFQLRSMFNLFGQIENIYTVDQSQGHDFKYGYIVFQDEAAANSALQGMQNTSISGHKLRIEFFSGKKSSNTTLGKGNQLKQSGREQDTKAARSNRQQIELSGRQPSEACSSKLSINTLRPELANLNISYIGDSLSTVNKLIHPCLKTKLLLRATTESSMETSKTTEPVATQTSYMKGLQAKFPSKRVAGEGPLRSSFSRQTGQCFDTNSFLEVSLLKKILDNHSPENICIRIGTFNHQRFAF